MDGGYENKTKQNKCYLQIVKIFIQKRMKEICLDTPNAKAESLTGP